jgi:hypothetical protein
MLFETEAEGNFRDRLLTIDEAIAARVAAAGCPHCGGSLHRADYPRKPRGGGVFPAGEAFTRRLSLCCDREGCRRRSTPPSVRFFGRRVHLGLVVLLAHAYRRACDEVRALLTVTQRTLDRWARWWQTAFVATAFFTDARARFAPPLALDALPDALLARFGDTRATATWGAALRFLSPNV